MSKNKKLVKIIEPGWGSSGYYSESVLKKFAKKFEGVQMYWDHPKKSDVKDRPERSLSELAATLTNVSYQENGKEGPGIYGIATVFKKFLSPLNEMANHIGVSIRASGEAEKGSAAGRKGNIVKSIDDVFSVDFVTKPGAGGKIIAAFQEAAKLTAEEQEMIEESEGGDNMDEFSQKLEALESKVQDLSEQLSESKEDLKIAEDRLKIAETESENLKSEKLVSEAESIVDAELDSSDLIEAGKARVKSGIKIEDFIRKGEVRDQKLVEAVKSGIKAEAEYISQFAESGIVKVNSKQKKQEVSVEDAFSRIGLSESAAKIAANGR